MAVIGVGTATGGSATADAEDTKGGGEDGGVTGEFLEAGVEHAANQGRMLGNTHGGPLRAGQGIRKRKGTYKKKAECGKCEKGRNPEKSPKTGQRPEKPFSKGPEKCEKKPIPHGCHPASNSAGSNLRRR
jgi:hypothetical protein